MDNIVETTLDDNIVAYLLSYPKSGNSWLRYIIEYMTGIPTIYEGHMFKPIPLAELSPTPRRASINAAAFDRIGTMVKSHIDYPISSQPGCSWREERMKYDKGLILKKHFAQDVGGGHPLDPAINEESKLIFLIRDPRDCSIRHEGTSWVAHAASAELYLKYPGPKIIIYYEDLVKAETTEKVIIEITTFLGEDHDVEKEVKQFMEEYDTHFKLSAQAYRTFGNGKPEYQTKTLNTDYKPYKNHHLSDPKTAATRNKELLKLCEKPEIAEIFKPYLERMYTERPQLRAIPGNI